MKLKGINSSSKKTIRLIKNTFAELLKEKKEINNITVTELVKRADITRGAFYSHYDNIYDIAQEIESEIQDIAFSNINKINSKEDINDFIDLLFNYLEENEDFYYKVLQSNDPILFINRLSNKFLYSLKNALNTNNKEEEITLYFITDGAAILLIKYFRKESNFTLEDIKECLIQAINKLF